MKIAISLYETEGFENKSYKASELSYDMVKQKGVICPECFEPVFLVIRQNALPYLSHYSSKESKLCSNRAKSKRGKELKRLTGYHGHYQCLKLFNSRFVSIILAGNKFNKKESFFNKEITKNCNLNVLKPLTEELHAVWGHNLIEIKYRFEGALMMVLNDKTSEPHLGFMKTLDVTKHRLICFKAIDFLATVKGFKAFSSLVNICIYKEYAAKVKHLGKDELILTIVALIACTDWCKYYEEVK